MGGVSSRFDDTDWTKADGKLRFGNNDTIDGAPPSQCYQIYTLTKRATVGMGGQRDYDVSDEDSNLLYTTRAVEGTIAWFDVLGKGIDEYLLRVQVDLTRRYWVVYSYGFPAFAGQLSDTIATEKASRRSKSDMGTPFLYRKACITVSWARYEAIIAFYGPQLPEISDCSERQNKAEPNESESETSEEVNKSIGTSNDESDKDEVESELDCSHKQQEGAGEIDNAVELPKIVSDEDGTRASNDDKDLENKEYEGPEDEKKTDDKTDQRNHSECDGLTCTSVSEENEGNSTTDKSPEESESLVQEEKTGGIPPNSSTRADETASIRDNVSIVGEEANGKTESHDETHSATKEGRGKEYKRANTWGPDTSSRGESFRSSRFSSLRNFASSFRKRSGGKNQSESTDGSLMSTQSLVTSDAKERGQARTRFIRSNLSYVNLKRLVQEPSAHTEADPMWGVLQSHAPVLKVQEINSIMGQHQTVLPEPNDAKFDQDGETNGGRPPEIQGDAGIRDGGHDDTQEKRMEVENEKEQVETATDKEGPHEKEEPLETKNGTDEIVMAAKQKADDVAIETGENSGIADKSIAETSAETATNEEKKEDDSNICQPNGVKKDEICHEPTACDKNDTAKEHEVGNDTVNDSYIACVADKNDGGNHDMENIEAVDDDKVAIGSDKDATTMESCTTENSDNELDQPLVGFWSWENTLMVHKITMHVAKNSDIALHVILAIVTNQLRYERNAGVAAAV